MEQWRVLTLMNIQNLKLDYMFNAYTATNFISEVEHSYKMNRETSGSAANYYIGPMTPVECIQGLETANLTEILIPGEDEEEKEVFSKRYVNSFDKQAFVGNREDYIQKVKSI